MISIKEIAKLANTSIASVSRVINNKPGVNPAVRARVESVIAEHDFRPNLLARELIQGKTHLIGISLPTIHSFYAAWIAGITDVCHSQHYNIMMASGRQNPLEELSNLNLFLEKQVEGLIYIVTHLNEALIERLAKVASRIPVVLVGQEIPGLKIPAVIPDHLTGATQLMTHLIQTGHRSIAHISGRPDNHSARLRQLAWRETQIMRGLSPNPELLVAGDFTLPTGYESTRTLLARGVRPDAIFYANDMMALGGMRALEEAGIRVPQDVSVCGFDDIELAAYSKPPLTTVNQDYHDVGSKAADMLFARLNDPGLELAHLKVEQRLVIRESTMLRKPLSPLGSPKA